MRRLRLRTYLSGFDEVRLDKCKIYVHREFANERFKSALAAGEETLKQRYQLTPVAASDFARVCRLTVKAGSGEERLYIKHYPYRSGGDFIKHLLRPSRAMRAFAATMMLRENGFDAPEVIAVGKCKAGLFCTRNFLVTREVENARRIHERLADYGGDIKREMIKAFGRTVGAMHRAGIFHGDLRAGNILARRKEKGWQFFFLDNERTRQFRRLPDRLRLKNLVQANMLQGCGITNTDRIRFFKAYLEENPEIAERRKYWLKKTIARTKYRLAKRSSRK